MFHVKQSAEELHIVPFSNARLNHRRRPQTCLRMFRLHEQRPREDVGCEIEFRFWDEL